MSAPIGERLRATVVAAAVLAATAYKTAPDPKTAPDLFYRAKGARVTGRIGEHESARRHGRPAARS
jgi:hypothetical protein